MGVTFPLLSLRNKGFTHLGMSVVIIICDRIISTMKGEYVDIPSDHTDKIFPIPEIEEQDEVKDYIFWPLPKMDGATKLKLIKDSLRIANLTPYK